MGLIYFHEFYLLWIFICCCPRNRWLPYIVCLIRLCIFIISVLCQSLFGHVTRLAEDTASHQALRCHVDMTLGRLPDCSWRRRPGHPRNRWLDQLCGDTNNTPPVDLWRWASKHEHLVLAYQHICACINRAVWTHFCPESWGVDLYVSRRTIFWLSD